MRESEERIAKLFAFVRRWQPARQDIALLSKNRALQTSVSFRGAERRISDSMKWRVHTSRSFRAVIEQQSYCALPRSALTMPRDVLLEYLPLPPAAHTHRVRVARVVNRTESLNNIVHLRGIREFALRRVT